MHAILCVVLLAAEVVHFGRSFGDSVPTLDKGHLFYLQHQAGRMTAYGPNGLKLVETTVLDPQGRAVAFISSVAVDTDGTIAVNAAHMTSQGSAGGIAMLDASGKQTRFVPTGRYRPSNLCFDKNHFLWAFGSQQDETGIGMEDKRDYMIVRKFSKDGKETGSYLPRSLFARGLSPFPARGGTWWARASQDRIGVFARPNDSRLGQEWVELDLDGNLMGRWNVGKMPKGGHAYTADGRLFVRSWDPKSKAPQLAEFDRNARAWVPVEDVSTAAGDDFAESFLLGADGNDLVFAADAGLRLVWLKPKPASR